MLLRSTEAKHEVEDHILYLGRTAIRFIDLVNHHDWLQAHLNGLLQDKAGLRHRPLKGVYEEKAPVGQVKHTLYLTAEVSVTWRIDDVDLYVLVADTYVLG